MLGSKDMSRPFVIACVCLALTACGDSAQKQATQSPPVRIACTTPEQAGMKASDLTRQLVEAKKQGSITQDQYTALNNTMSTGFRAWAEHQDLRTYCAALDRVVKDSGLN